MRRWGRGTKLCLRPDQIRRIKARLRDGDQITVIARDMGFVPDTLRRLMHETGEDFGKAFFFCAPNRLKRVAKTAS